MEFYQAGRLDGSFDEGIQAALERLLIAPDFLFRVERDPAGVAPGTTYRISDIELASRLSFFLWSSIPDDELLGLAERGELGKPDVLERQVRRMLADPRSRALVDNFAGQWLRLRDLSSVVPDPVALPGVRREPPRGLPAGDGAVPGEPDSRRPKRRGAVERELHVRQRAARAALRHPERLRLALPPRGARRGAGGAAGRHPRPWQPAHRHVVSQSYVAGAARQVGARQHARHAAAAAAAGRARSAEQG